MTDMTIREYIPQERAGDGELLLPAFLAIWNAPENLRFLSFTQKPFDEPTVRGWFSQHRGAGVHYYAAEGEKGIAGIAVVKADPVEGFEVTGIGVRPESKRHGAGTALLEHVLSVAAGEGFGAVEAMVFADNAAMLRLLLSLSFIPVGMDFNRRCDGADTVRMKRVL